MEFLVLGMLNFNYQNFILFKFCINFGLFVVTWYFGFCSNSRYLILVYHKIVRLFGFIGCINRPQAMRHGHRTRHGHQHADTDINLRK